MDSLLIKPTFFDESLIELANKFFETHDSYENGPYFIEEDDMYKMEIALEGASLDDMSVKIEDEKYLKIDYFYQTENSTYSYSAKELLPFDANPETVCAEFTDGKLIISVKRK